MSDAIIRLNAALQGRPRISPTRKSSTVSRPLSRSNPHTGWSCSRRTVRSSVPRGSSIVSARTGPCCYESLEEAHSRDIARRSCGLRLPQHRLRSGGEAIRPAGLHRGTTALLTSDMHWSQENQEDRKPQPGPDLNIHRGAQQPPASDVFATLHPFDERIQPEGRESCARGQPHLHGVQFLHASRNAHKGAWWPQDHSSDGRWHY